VVSSAVMMTRIASVEGNHSSHSSRMASFAILFVTFVSEDHETDPALPGPEFKMLSPDVGDAYSPVVKYNLLFLTTPPSDSLTSPTRTPSRSRDLHLGCRRSRDFTPRFRRPLRKLRNHS